MNTKLILLALMFISSSIKSADSVKRVKNYLKAVKSSPKGPFSRSRAPLCVLTHDGTVPRFSELLWLWIHENPVETVRALVEGNSEYANATDRDLRGTTFQTILMYVAGNLANVEATKLLLKHGAQVEAYTSGGYEGCNNVFACVHKNAEKIKELIEKETGSKEVAQKSPSYKELPISNGSVLRGLKHIINKERNKTANVGILEQHLQKLPKGVVGIICDYGWQGEKAEQEKYASIEKGFDYVTIHDLLWKKRMEELT